MLLNQEPMQTGIFKDILHSKTTLTICLGMVALVVGGLNFKNVELYSPNGACARIFSPVPSLSSSLQNPVVGIVNETVFVCDDINRGMQTCWTYNVDNDTWSLYTEAANTHYYPGIYFDDRIYLPEIDAPEVYDAKAKTWSPLPAPLVDLKLSSCVAATGDVVMLLRY